MARPCMICTHPKREEIEGLINSGRYTDTYISERYHIGRKGISNHKINHMAKGVRAEIKSVVKEAENDLDQLNSLADKMNSIEDMVEDIFKNAKMEGHESLALSAAKELRGQLETATKVSGELRAQAEMKNQLNWREEWAEVRSILDEVFEMYPEAGEEFDKKLLFIRSKSFS